MNHDEPSNAEDIPEYAQYEDKRDVSGLDGPALFSETLPSQLYHYTDLKGLVGILETHSLWATYNRTFNDGSDQTFGEGILRDFLNTRRGSSTLSADTRSVTA